MIFQCETILYPSEGLSSLVYHRLIVLNDFLSSRLQRVLLGTVSFATRWYFDILHIFVNHLASLNVKHAYLVTVVLAPY